VSAGSGTKHIYGVTPAAPLAGAAGVVEDAQIHGPGMQIDAAVESVRLVVESHHGTPMGPGVGARIVVGRCTLPENPTLGPKPRGLEPVYPWDRLPSHPTGGHEDYPNAADVTMNVKPRLTDDGTV